MHYGPLGNSDIQISRICLGTMTFGRQNSEAEAHAQFDYAMGQGVNFIDTAEMYPVPVDEQTDGVTESIVGSWLARQSRDKVILATKASGPGRYPWPRGGRLDYTRANLREAVEGSLKRLRTDYVDLYQLHWPDRNVPFFGKVRYEPENEFPHTPLRETLEGLGELIRAGKIRHWGLSNETPWGLMTFLRLADQHGLPRPLTVQNNFSLVCRTWDNGLAEIAYRENIGLLAYSPLAFGYLTAKYLEDPQATGRFTAFPDFVQRYRHRARLDPAVAAYAALARKHGLTPAQLAIAWVNSQGFVSSNIIGATNMKQLAENIGAAACVLAPEILVEIDALHDANPNPVV